MGATETAGERERERKREGPDSGMIGAGRGCDVGVGKMYALCKLLNSKFTTYMYMYMM